MAIQKDAMLARRTEVTEPRIAATLTRGVQFNIAGADKTLPVGTILAFRNATVIGWVEWANGGSEGTARVRGIVYPSPVKILAAGEVIGTIMLRGEAHRDELVSDGGTAVQLETALRAEPGPRELGLDIVGMTEIR